MRDLRFCIFTAFVAENYRETRTVDVTGEGRRREATVVREDKNKWEGKETCVVQELLAFMWLRIGVYEDSLDGVFCAYRKSVADEAPSMYSYIVSKGRGHPGTGHEDTEWE